MNRQAERARPKVSGDRKCGKCHGLCHEDSWRDKVGRRKNYWCSEDCLRDDWNGVYVSNADWVGFRDRNFERVDVGSK